MNSRTTSTVFPCLCYDDALVAIEWLCTAFGFERRLLVPGSDDTVIHSELTLDNAVIMVNTARPEQGRHAPAGLAGMPQMLSVHVADPDAHHERAVAAGAEIVEPLADAPHRARGYTARDLEGHLWHFSDYRPGDYWDSMK
jgi:uncharacterized glyoxalase superfamily protein PhnB